VGIFYIGISGEFKSYFSILLIALLVARDFSTGFSQSLQGFTQSQLEGFTGSSWA
jgi:hypothetical protein